LLVGLLELAARQEMQEILVLTELVGRQEMQEIMVLTELAGRQEMQEIMVLTVLEVLAARLELTAAAAAAAAPVEQHSGVVVVLMEWVVMLVLLQLQTVLEVEELDVDTLAALYFLVDPLVHSRLVLLDLVEGEEVLEQLGIQEQQVAQDKQDLLVRQEILVLEDKQDLLD
jgi:hypothetical protein